MEKVRLVIFSLIIFLMGNTNTFAVCELTETNELNKLASNVKVSYEVSGGEEIDKNEALTPPDGLSEEEIEEWKKDKVYTPVYKVYITNITKEMYVTVNDKLAKTTTTYQFQDAVNGTITVIQPHFESIDEFTITIYSSKETNCPDTKLTTLYITTPMYNSYSSYYLCNGAEEFYLCHQYLTVLPVSFSEFEILVTEYKNGKVNKDGNSVKDNEKERITFWEFVKENKFMIIGVSSGVVITGGIVVGVIIKRKRKNESWNIK